MECGAKEESEKKNEEENRESESPSLSPLPHPLVVCFFCSHLFALSPRSERLEQARHLAAPNHSPLRKWVMAGTKLSARAFMGSFGETENPEQLPGILPGRATCCVPLCPNNFKNSHGLAFYRIPKARRIRREYVRLFRNDDLNLNSDSTRICSALWDGCWDANWNNRRISRSIGMWIKIDWREKDKLAKEKDKAKTSWLEIERDFSMHWKIRSLTFQNLRKRMKISNFTVAFHTRMHLCFFTTCYMTRSDKAHAQNLNYGSYAKKNTGPG